MAKSSKKASKTSSVNPKTSPERAESAPERRTPSSGVKRHSWRSLPSWALILALFLSLGAVFAFIFAIANLFSTPKITLDPDYYSATTSLEVQDPPFLATLTPDRLSELLSSHQTFVLFVDQPACSVADRLRGFIHDYTAETGLLPYRVMFSDLQETDLSNSIHYYPSVAIISSGRLLAFLDTSSDEHLEEYNDYAAFKTWLDSYLNQ